MRSTGARNGTIARAPDDESGSAKSHSAPLGNTEKDPDEWVSGDEPMTGAQASYLKTLSQQAMDDQAFDPNLTKAEASKRIDALKAKLGLQGNPPHVR